MTKEVFIKKLNEEFQRITKKPFSQIYAETIEPEKLNKVTLEKMKIAIKLLPTEEEIDLTLYRADFDSELPEFTPSTN